MIGRRQLTMLVGNGTKALEYALSEYKKRPNNNDVNGLLAKIYSHEGNFEKAKKHLKVALQTGAQKPVWLELKKELKI